MLLPVLSLTLSAQRAPEPVNPHASPEARALLQYFYSISGHYTLSGQHNYPNTIGTWTDRAYDLTGKFPALYGSDFGFQGGADKDSVLARPELIAEAIRQYRNGSVITLTWHAVRPIEDEPVKFTESVQGKLSDFEWNELLTPGTDLNKRWCAQVDVIAGYLRQLRDAHVPVLWRPYHEVNGSWFWWGGRKGPHGSAALYRQMFDRFVNYHHLDNLVWVWNANSPGDGHSGPGPYVDYFPGLEYADMLSVDIYGEFKQSHYDDLVTLAAGKPVALGEVGSVPSPASLKAQPGYTYFMAWSEFVEMGNPLDNLRETYLSPNVLGRDDAPFAGPMAAIRKAAAPFTPEPVTPGASKAAKELLATLNDAPANAILSGQDNSAAVAGATQQVLAVAGKSPAIYGQDLGNVKAIAAILEEAKHQSKNHAVISLSWRPSSPDIDQPVDDKSVQNKVSDFEWRELLTPGTNLNKKWIEQVEQVAESLKKLEEAGIAVLWRPYPESNGTKYWWAGRKGINGSAALYRALFDQLAKEHKLRNLIWVWDAVPAGFDPEGLAQYPDYFPGLAYVDAISVQLADSRFAFRQDTLLARFGIGKPVGFDIAGKAPAAAMFDRPSKWSWFLASPDVAADVSQADALKKLYGSAHVASLAVEGATK
jgi:mannan endo-1,4-beta-mannosidase